MKKYIITWSIFIICTFIIFLANKDFLYYKNFSDLYNNEEYSQLSSINTIEKKSPENYHNLWNTWYRIFQESKLKEDLEKSVRYYSWSLDISENDSTRYNYEFTKTILDFLDTQQQEQEEQEQQEEQEMNNSAPQEWEPEESTKEQWDSQEWQNSQESENIQSSQDTRWNQYYLWEEDTVKKLSEDEKAFLEEQLKVIRQWQSKNQQFFGKQSEENQFWNIFDNFFGEVDRWWEKDW